MIVPIKRLASFVYPVTMIDCKAALLFLFLLPVQSIAQNTNSNKNKKQGQEMNTDMPDETVETSLVDKGQLQIETAVLYNRFRESPQAKIGELLIRYGLSDRVEVRVSAEDGVARDRYLEETVQSNYPLALGAKIILLKDHDQLPDITLMSGLKLPFTSRSGDQSTYWSPIFLVAFQNSFYEKWKLEYNAGIQQEVFSADWVWLANGSLHYKIQPALEAFVEYYAQFKPGELPQHNVGGGLSFQHNNQISTYISGGSSVEYHDYNYFFIAGIAFRTN